MKQFAILLLVASLSFAAEARPAPKRHAPKAPPGLSVRATDNIFAAGVTAKSLKPDQGTIPAFVPVTAGESLKISAVGKARCCGSGGVSAGPKGFDANPFGGGSRITNNLGTPVGTFEIAKGAFPLVAVFMGANDDHTPFVVGDLKTVTVPQGATKLYFGYADANLFNGAASTYSDNFGGMTVRVERGK